MAKAHATYSQVFGEIAVAQYVMLTIEKHDVFLKGDVVRTSTVTSVGADGTFETRNTIYKAA